jgi:hypothetical protein
VPASTRLRPRTTGRDAYVLAHSLKTDAHAFKAVSAEHPVIVELRERSRMHRELSEERVRLTKGRSTFL